MHGSNLLAAWRKTAEKSQTECAEFVGVRQPTWSEWEGGRKNPQIAHAVKIEELTKDTETGVPAVPVSSWGPIPRGAPMPVGSDAPPATGTEGA